MTKLSPIKRRKFEAFLRLVGCRLKRMKGDHLVYSRRGLKRPVIITTDSEVPLFIIRNNLRTLGISVEEYLALIEQI